MRDIQEGIQIARLEEMGICSGKSISNDCNEDSPSPPSDFQDKRTSVQTAAAANLLNSLLTTGDILGLEAAGLQLGGTLGQATRLNRSIAHEGTALGSLGLVVVTGVGGSK